MGFLPVYNASGQPTKAGGGLLGNPYLMGTTASKLNPLCSDYANGFRLPGLFVTANDAYDGAAQFDNNQNAIQAGAYLHVFADFGFLSTAYAQNYVNNGTALVAGFLSQLDEKVGLTNKPLRMTQVWNALPAQLEALTEAKINVLRSKGVGQNPAMLHDLTAATVASDYTNLVRVRCMGKVIQTVLARADRYVGHSSLDGLALVSMQSQLIQTRSLPRAHPIIPPAPARQPACPNPLFCSPLLSLLPVSRPPSLSSGDPAQSSPQSPYYVTVLWHKFVYDFYISSAKNNPVATLTGTYSTGGGF